MGPVLIFRPPRELIIEAAAEMEKIPCLRKQPEFNLDSDGSYRIWWLCGTNSGPGSDNGYGIGHTCTEDCDLRIRPKRSRKK